MSKIYVVNGNAYTDEKVANMAWKLARLGDHMSGGYGCARMEEAEIDKISLDEIETSLENGTKQWGDSGYKKGQLMDWKW